MTAQELINERQQLFEAVKTKAVKCSDRTQLCSAIYPWESEDRWLERYAPMYEFYMLQMQAEFIDHEENYGDRV